VVKIDREGTLEPNPVVVLATSVQKIHRKDLYEYLPKAARKYHVPRAIAKCDDEGASLVRPFLPHTPPRVGRFYLNVIADIRGEPRVWEDGPTAVRHSPPPVCSLGPVVPSARQQFPNAEVIIVPPEGDEDLEADWGLGNEG
jgi:hypothetical protein